MAIVKYTLSTTDTVNHFGTTLYRIIYTDRTSGGYIQSVTNLSQNGNCLVMDSARVLGTAVVSGNAIVRGFAIISGNTTLGDPAISGESRIGGNSVIGPGTIVQ